MGVLLALNAIGLEKVPLPWGPDWLLVEMLVLFVCLFVVCPQRMGTLWLLIVVVSP